MELLDKLIKLIDRINKLVVTLHAHPKGAVALIVLFGIGVFAWMWRP